MEPLGNIRPIPSKIFAGPTRARFVRQFCGIKVSQNTQHMFLDFIDSAGLPNTWIFVLIHLDSLDSEQGLALISTVYDAMVKCGARLSYGNVLPSAAS